MTTGAIARAVAVVMLALILRAVLYTARSTLLIIYVQVVVQELLDERYRVRELRDTTSS